MEIAEYIMVGLLVAGAMFCVVRRLVKGVESGVCGSCKCCGTDGGASCSPDETAATDETTKAECECGAEKR